MAIYEIPVGKIEAVREKMATIAKKCKKYGCEFLYVEHEVTDSFRKVCVYDEFNRQITKKIAVKVIPVEVGGKAIIDGWEFAAVIEHHEKGNIIKSGTMDIEVPEQYKTCGPWCDHCKKIRSRKDSYLVRNIESGELKQVGKACLMDYTNGLDPQKVANFATSLDEARSYFEDELWLGGDKSDFFDIETVLAVTSAVVTKYGYVRTRNDYNELNEDSTKNRVTEVLDCIRNPHLFDYMRRDHEEEIKALISKSYEDQAKEEAVKTRKYFMNELTEDEIESSNYLRNLYILICDSAVEMKNVGFIASAITVYRKHINKIAAEQKRAEELEAQKQSSGFVGTVGERITLKNVIGECVSSWESVYGMTYLYKFEDENGNVFSCFATNPVGIQETKDWFPVTPEYRWDIKATVKKHDEYKGVKQTILQRCKVLAKGAKVS